MLYLCALDTCFSIVYKHKMLKAFGRTEVAARMLGGEFFDKLAWVAERWKPSKFLRTINACVELNLGVSTK